MPHDNKTGSAGQQIVATCFKGITTKNKEKARLAPGFSNA